MYKNSSISHIISQKLMTSVWNKYEIICLSLIINIPYKSFVRNFINKSSLMIILQICYQCTRKNIGISVQSTVRIMISDSSSFKIVDKQCFSIYLLPPLESPCWHQRTYADDITWWKDFDSYNKLLKIFGSLEILAKFWDWFDAPQFMWLVKFYFC